MSIFNDVKKQRTEEEAIARLLQAERKEQTREVDLMRAALASPKTVDILGTHRELNKGNVPNAPMSADAKEQLRRDTLEALKGIEGSTLYNREHLFSKEQLRQELGTHAETLSETELQDLSYIRPGMPADLKAKIHERIAAQLGKLGR